MEYRGYNDYMVEVYSGDDRLGTFQYVSNVWMLTFWLRVHFLYWKWTSLKVYHRMTNIFIGEYKRGENIPAKPQL